MSSKKKAQKEKEDAKSNLKCHTFVLESDKAVLVKSNIFPLFSDAISINCGRPYGALNPLDWTAFRAWLHETPPRSVVVEVQEYASESLRDPQDNSLPAFKLAGATDEELNAFFKTHWTRRKLLNAWEDYVVHRLGSLVLYPRHAVRFTYVACADHAVHHGSSCPAFTLGAVIRRLLHTHSEWSNKHPKPVEGSNEKRAAAPLDPAREYKPEIDFQKIIGHSIRCSGFVTALKEQKDVTFNYVAREGEEEEGEECMPHVGSGNRRVVLTSHFNSTYINVCCGKNYYQLQVLDAERRRIMPLSAISAALDLIYEDAKQRDASLMQLNVSDEVRDDLNQFYSLLARMTATCDDVDADIHRRLCEVSEVNAYNLEILEGALFTVIIDGPSRATERENDAQWLHSIFSLHVQWDKPTEFYATSVAVVSSTTLRTFLKAAMTNSMPSSQREVSGSRLYNPATADQLSPYSREDSADIRPRAENSSPSFLDTHGSMQTPHGPHVVHESNDKLFQPLEFWLSQKHRTALKPYPPIAPAPKWRPECLWLSDTDNGEILSVSHFCAAVVLAVERVLLQEIGSGCKSRRPRVVFAYHSPYCATPSVVSLVTREMQEYIQAIRSPSALINPLVKRTAAERGIRSLTERLQSCVDAPYSLYSLSRSAYAWEKEVTADVCLTFGILSQAYTKDCGTFSVQSLSSELFVPSRLQVNGTAVQVCAQKNVLLGNGAVRRAELAAGIGCEGVGDAFAEALEVELLEVRRIQL